MDIHKEYFVYHLIDKRKDSPTYNLPIYIGQTCLPLHARLDRHVTTKGSHFFGWDINDLSIQPLVTLPENESLDNKQLSLDVEAKYINTYLNRGLVLYNKQVRKITNSYKEIKIKCTTTGEVDTLNNLCKRYNIIPRTLIIQANKKLNCGIDENDRPLFWELLTPITIEKKEKKYYVYAIYNGNKPIYVGKTNNINSRRCNHYSAEDWNNPLLHYFLETHSNTKLKVIETYKTDVEAKDAEQELTTEYSKNYILFNGIYNTRYNRLIQYFCRNELKININNTSIEQLSTLNLHPALTKILEKYIDVYTKLKSISKYIKKNESVRQYINRYNDETKYNIVAVMHNDVPCFITYVMYGKLINLKRIYTTAHSLKEYILDHNTNEFSVKVLGICNSEEQAKDIRMKLVMRLSKRYKLCNDSMQCDIAKPLSSNIDGIHNEDLSYNWFVTKSFVYCISTDTIFSSLAEASETCNITRHCIAHSCRSSSYAGMLQDGTRLKWTYV